MTETTSEMHNVRSPGLGGVRDDPFGVSPRPLNFTTTGWPTMRSATVPCQNNLTYQVQANGVVLPHWLLAQGSTNRSILPDQF